VTLLAAQTFDTGFPIRLSLQVALIAVVIVTPIGLALAWIQAKKHYRGRSLVDALILLPLVLPPSVIGYFLVVLCGQRGPVGQILASVFDVRLIFTPAGAVLASAIVALPLLVKTVQPSLESVPRDLERVGRSLGLGPIALFFRVSLPSAWPGVVAGLVLAFARAVGEFGATLMFAGNIPGRTNTMPLEIFAAYQQGDDDRAVLYVLVLTGFSLAVVFIASSLASNLALRRGAA
jgi:molybdate transport system permease protein